MDLLKKEKIWSIIGKPDEILHVSEENKVNNSKNQLLIEDGRKVEAGDYVLRDNENVPLPSTEVNTGDRYRSLSTGFFQGFSSSSPAPM
jgi:hypothetical protein